MSAQTEHYDHEACFMGLVTSYAPLILGTCLMVARRNADVRVDTQDMVQDVYEELFRYLQPETPVPLKRTYLRAAVRNAANRYIRRERRHQFVHAPLPEAPG
jgi:DNA-directed RNA polymerase specialized sigma24 family protein